MMRVFYTSDDEGGTATAEAPAKKKVAKPKHQVSNVAGGSKVVHKKAAKKAAPKKEPKERKPGDLNGSEVKILTALKNGKPLTRAELSEKTDIKKGWSKLLGSSTKDGFGANANGLEARKLVASAVPGEGEGRALTYTITEKGKKALADHKE